MTKPQNLLTYLEIVFVSGVAMSYEYLVGCQVCLVGGGSPYYYDEHLAHAQGKVLSVSSSVEGALVTASFMGGHPHGPFPSGSSIVSEQATIVTENVTHFSFVFPEWRCLFEEGQAVFVHGYKWVRYVRGFMSKLNSSSVLVGISDKSTDAEEVESYYLRWAPVSEEDGVLAPAFPFGSIVRVNTPVGSILEGAVSHILVGPSSIFYCVRTPTMNYCNIPELALEDAATKSKKPPKTGKKTDPTAFKFYPPSPSVDVAGALNPAVIYPTPDPEPVLTELENPVDTNNTVSAGDFDFGVDSSYSHYGAVSLYAALSKDTPSGNRLVVLPWAVTEVPSGEETAPAIKLTKASAIRLMDALWSAGIRPSDFKPGPTVPSNSLVMSCAEFDIREQYLKDMRALVSSVLKVEL